MVTNVAACANRLLTSSFSKTPFRRKTPNDMAFIVSVNSRREVS